jgi:hypothetical protein
MKEKTTAELNQQIRRDWGNIKPYTRTIPNKKLYNRKEKHKKVISDFS